MKGISVIICCYNSAARISTVLQHLLLQNANPDMFWEIVLIDNNCTDNTVEIAKNYWSKSGSSVPFKIFKEFKPGLSFARDTGVKNSIYDLVLFCDDDNHLSNNYLTSMWSLFNNRPVGIASAISIPCYETDPPTWFLNNESCFAIGTPVDYSCDVTDSLGWVWGAGMVIDRRILEKKNSIGFVQYLSDRVGSKMSTGGDVELCLVASKLGFRIWFNADCSFIHFMPTARFSFEKFTALVYQNALNSSYFDLFKANPPSRLRILKRCLFYLKKNLSASIKKNVDDPVKLWLNRGYFWGNMMVFWKYNSHLKNIKKLRETVYDNYLK